MNDPRRTLALACVAVALLAVASGCAVGSGTTIALSAKDSGSTKSMQVGQQLRVSLDSNPSTGYQWEINGPLPATLSQSDEPTFTASSGAIGSGGTEVWTFMAQSSGKGKLEMKYWRSFEATAPPVKTFDVMVDVK